jgi:hypothetical protein
MEVSGKLYTPVALPLGKNPGTFLIGGWVAPRASLDSFSGTENVLSIQGFEPHTVQLIAGRYTDCIL